MNKFIIKFKATYPGIDAVQYSCFTRKQAEGVLDRTSIAQEIASTSSMYFFSMYDKSIEPNKIIVEIDKIERFK